MTGLLLALILILSTDAVIGALATSAAITPTMKPTRSPTESKKFDPRKPPPIDDNPITATVVTSPPTFSPTGVFGLPRTILNFPELTFTVDDSSLFLPSIPSSIVRTFSLSMIIRCNAVDDDQKPQELLSIGRTKSSEINSVEMFIDDAGRLTYVERDSFGKPSNVVVSNSVVATGGEEFIVLVKNRNAVTIYVNGALDSQHSISQTLPSLSTLGISIGGDPTNDNKKLFGTIKSLKMFDVPLSFPQVSRLQLTASPSIRPTRSPTISPTATPTTLVVSTVPGFSLVLKSGATNAADCDGVYLVKGTLNDKPVYINKSKPRWIGWNGASWAVIDMISYDAILATQAQNFNSIQISSNGNVDIMNSVWSQYDVVYPSFVFENIPGAGNYANNDGTFVYSAMLNNRPAFVNTVKNRFIGWNGGRWAVANAGNLQDFVARQVSGFSGFYFSINGNVQIYDSMWNAYKIKPLL